jgi:hypothetical protein
MSENRERQMDVDVTETSEEQLRNEQIAEDQAKENQDRAPTNTVSEEVDPLFENDEAERFRTHWLNIQSKFVDNPRESVREADELVAGVLKSVTMGFHNRRSSLEKEWNSGSNVSTEDLRLALKRYRSFFDRLLTLES